MRQKTEKEQFVDIVGMHYDIIIIKNNSSEVSGSCYGFFLQVLVSFATVCILTVVEVNKSKVLKCLREEDQENSYFLIIYLFHGYSSAYKVLHHLW